MVTTLSVYEREASLRLVFQQSTDPTGVGYNEPTATIHGCCMPIVLRLERPLIDQTGTHLEHGLSTPIGRKWLCVGTNIRADKENETVPCRKLTSGRLSQGHMGVVNSGKGSKERPRKGGSSYGFVLDTVKPGILGELDVHRLHEGGISVHGGQRERALTPVVTSP
ncbi:hypothetical protein FA13DRAFT_690246 [Coprinellus micaceus]|uniref:Uncharacterized protein n=1 Tax=Coprinellus micaceus TaxID=71717 RepID=A0A4Y7T4K6_COPMI|nr:hypothetical protein FA13DRAFT_690246 [Coprinellus micaceus]